MPKTFNELLREAVSIRLDKREDVPADQRANFDPYICLTLADGTEVYVADNGAGQPAWGNGSAA